MTDAELIALAAIVNASCTQIAAANQMRAHQNCAPAYQGYQDCFGVDAAAKVTQEIQRREEERAWETAPCHTCKGPVGPGWATCVPCKVRLCGLCVRVHTHVADAPRPQPTDGESKG